MDYAAKSVAVDETIVYPNHTGQALTGLLLAVEPNLSRYGSNSFTLRSLSLNGSLVASPVLDSHKLSFALTNVLQPEATVTISIKYDLNLPQLNQVKGVRPQIFGYSPLQINLTDWYPFVVPFMNGNWVLHDDWYDGEHLVYDAADYSVNLKFVDPSNAPVVASSGVAEPQGDYTRYTLTSARAFVISASTGYVTSSLQINDVTVTSYYFQSFKKAGEAAMNTAVQALQVYSHYYGPYSHKTLSIVMGDFNDAMEFSALIFTSEGVYNVYNGTPQDLNVILAAHETAHQWWFEQVGNDQALQPWLDESLAAYSEHIFYETVYPQSVSWWWTYWLPRVGGKDSLPWVDTDIYSAGGFVQYTNTIYLHGAHFLDDLRTRIGDPAFFAFLQDYRTQESGKIATANEFFQILRLHTTTDFSDIVRQYFQSTY